MLPSRLIAIADSAQQRHVGFVELNTRKFDDPIRGLVMGSVSPFPTERSDSRLYNNQSLIAFYFYIFVWPGMTYTERFRRN